jgi:hypothetical protein
LLCNSSSDGSTPTSETNFTFTRASRFAFSGRISVAINLQ